ncbi:MAG: glucose 1-dehydrogenase [Alphaproteobacteria bacterium]|nr:glucose 1-dehydrogenase [Alphaproteobacteria bacterium]
MGRVEDKVALVTGGAAGIGRASALRLAAEGARVVVSDRDTQGGPRVASELGGGARFVSHDVRDEGAWQRALEETVAAFGRLDVLVNVAGILGEPTGQDPEHATLEEFRRINQVNLEGTFLGCKTAIPVLRASGGGSIVNISSVAGILGTPMLAAYGAGKAGVRQITKSVAVYCAQQGDHIRCNSIHPGLIETAMIEGVLRSAGGDDPEAARAAYRGRIPLGVFGSPEDVAHGVVYLASDEARYVTGAELVIDGGLTCY